MVKHQGRTVIIMQWMVIAVLIAGAVVGGYMLTNKVSTLSDSNASLSGDNDSLRSQLRQAKEQAAATPAPTPVPTVTPTPALSPSPTPKATVKP